MKFFAAIILKLILLIIPFIFIANSYAITKSEVVKILEQPNDSGTHRSIKTGFKDIKPCGNASYELQPIWIAAGKLFDIKWQILAAITEIESNFGCNMGPSSAGAIGWTQFMPDTWKRWGMDADGDGKAEPHNAVDAVFSSARYLRVTGAPENYKKAIFAYNHADWYVRDVLERSKKYGVVNLGQFKKLKELTKKGDKIKKEVVELTESYNEAKDLLKQKEKNYNKAKEDLKSTTKTLKLKRENYEDSKKQLNEITKDYVTFTQEVASSDKLAENSDSEQQLLNYITESQSPNDAVLVYQVASNLVNVKTNKLVEIRQQSIKTSQAYKEFQVLHKKKKDITIKKFDSYSESEKLKKEAKEKLSLGKKKLAKYKKLEKKYKAYYLSITGNNSALDESIYNNSEVVTRGEGEILVWPVSGKISSHFSSNRCLAGLCRPHEGIDIAIPNNTNIYASADGVVEYANFKGGYGNYICIAHSDNFSTCYAHLSSYKVSVGDKVKQNELIAKSGCTGRCFGPHLHYEIRVNQKAVNPLRYLKPNN